ncbi:serine hydrolase domain-containing protein [Kribbia dieselivorans]|uniref:serine hydrolase domain-containing protein n=1 Tax=Kribbia dieselivorans TaxID=331526 RepID=UPI00083897BB|nr:serine hydrolase [Kribbia dieselivorans]
MSEAARAHRPRRRRRVLTALLVVAALLVIAATAGYWWQRPMLRTGTGYAALNECGVRLLAHRDDPSSDLPSNPLVPYLRSDTSDTGSTTTILGVLAKQRAWYTEGYGCTLGSSAPALPAPVVADAARNPFSAQKVDPDPAVEKAIGVAFGEGLGTRAVLVIRDGQIVGERYADGFSASTRQVGWSMTKSVANLMAGRLVREGKLDVTADALRPEWTDDRRNITVEDLLRMTSGLVWDEEYVLGSTITTMLYDRADMAGFVAEQPLAHPPGRYQQYSSGSTNLLCAVLAERDGSPAATLPGRTLLAPLGMSSAVLETDAVGTPVCSSSLWATPRDWAAMGQFALQQGQWDGQRLLPPNWMSWSTQVHRGDGEEVGYGAGWWVNRLADGSTQYSAMPADTYWASGHDGQRVVVVPSRNLVVVRMGFSPDLDDTQLGMVDLVGALTHGR